MSALLPFSSFSSASFSSVYQSLTSSKSKDKIDTILEPLQAMIQLALLSIYPIGTKLCIQENILYIQSPNVIQPIVRWYNADKKDDVYFLYGVIKRYIKWYNPKINQKSPVKQELYQLITEMAIEGLNRLYRTYCSSDSNTVIHVIQMYKNLLESNNDKILADEYMLDMEKNKINIDEVFERIVEIYEPIVLNVLMNTLELIRVEEDMQNQTHMIEGLNLILYKNTKGIRDWIRLNLTL
jgi:hypothetical protein